MHNRAQINEYSHQLQKISNTAAKTFTVKFLLGAKVITIKD